VKLRAFLTLAIFAAALPALAAPNCPGYQIVGANCAFTTTYGWGTAGGGTDSVVTFYVPPEASGPVTFQATAFNSSLGNAYAGYFGLLVGQPGSVQTNLVTISQATPTVVNPGQAVEFLILQVCFDPTCTAAAPAGAVPNMFSVQLLMLSPVSSDLDVTPNPQLTVQFLSGNQVTFEEAETARHGGALNSYIPGINLGATPAGRYVYNGPAVTEPFDVLSVTNVGGSPITGTVTLQDLSAHPILTVALPAIPPGGAVGYLVIGIPGNGTAALFPASTVLPAGSDSIFHGNLAVTMSGANIVLAQEFNGNAMLNLLVFH
jgi:hypothetical protein